MRHRTFTATGHLVADEPMEDPGVGADAHAQARDDAVAAVARMVVAPMIAADELDGDTLTAVAALFPGWRPGEQVNTGDMKAWGQGVAEAAKAHHSTKTPDDAPTLWRVHRKPQETI